MFTTAPINHRPTNFRRGFTLVELSLTIAIIITLSAIAMPRYASAVASYRSRAAAKRISADLAQVQSFARTSSTAQTITFSSSTASYTIANLRDLDTSSTTYRVSLAAEPYRASIATLSLGSGGSITFDGYGNPNCGGTITVQSGTYTRSVVVDATTGKVAVQ
jgi:prepilin-type N-terminal cleavage/methylation domain-containing protein